MLYPGRRSFLFYSVGLALAVSGLWLALHWWFVTPTGATRVIYREPGFQGGVAQRDVVPGIDLDFISSAHAPRRFFSARWATVWYVERAGTYDLSLGADDRGVLRVDDAIVGLAWFTADRGDAPVPYRHGPVDDVQGVVHRHDRGVADQSGGRHACGRIEYTRAGVRPRLQRARRSSTM